MSAVLIPAAAAVPAVPAMSGAPEPLRVHVKFATSAAEVAATRTLRRAVFCDEQEIFTGDDVDAVDALAVPIVALLGAPGPGQRVVGTVRIHEVDSGTWFGSRLAVAPDARRIASVGSGLIRLAVSAAHARGCHTFLAHVQPQNVALFEKLHWALLRDVDVHRRPHVLMQADLAFYPPVLDGDTGLLLTREAR